MKARNNNIFKCTCVIVIIITVVLFMRKTSYNPFNNVNTNIDYPCRVVLSDNEFLRHMITHHQMAIDISIQHIKNTKNDIIMKVLRELIFTQKYEIILMLAELNHKTDNITTKAINNNDNITTMAINNNDNKQRIAFIPTISSFMYPNTIGLTNTYCDPAFFIVNNNQHQHQHQHTDMHNITTDKQYILHMIPHHQVAVDMCKILLQNTKSDFLIYLSYRMIREQEAEIILLNDLLNSPNTPYTPNTPNTPYTPYIN